ncbi:hypothetical protein CR105_23285 [Massilia eurypsychrophila]|jgi:hypothetical protein|uniref:Uncharacterized protein n=1 Tax=Massilia eurypsychrophila TaxID=1485217 RepID=A0A2G8TAE2_9BURK|nr:hypothetical protein [Massilia eurypsychrophila]PIL42658.1 hypothetical protein CR105_23285 [Massilia eurypsychrophila]
MGFNKNELATIAKTGPDAFSVKLRSGEGDFWYAFVILARTLEEHRILTARGDIKSWRNLDDAVLFFEKTCPECLNFEIEIGAWVLARRIESAPDLQ